MQTKKYATKQSMDPWRNQRGNLKIAEDKWKWKHNNPKSMGWAKALLRGKLIAIQVYIRNKRKISNKQSRLTPRGIRKRRTIKTQS